MPYFRVDDTFSIKGRNAVILVGEITEGILEKGMTIAFPDHLSVNKNFIISEFEMGTRLNTIDGSSEHESFFGILTYCDNEQQVQELLKLDLKGLELKILETS